MKQYAIVNLQGGLGNQIFQVAYALYLKSLGIKVVVDTHFFSSNMQFPRKLELIPSEFGLKNIYYKNSRVFDKFGVLFAETDTLIAHNAGFDIGVLRASAEAINFDLPNYGYGCSLRMSRKTYNLDSYRLNAVAYAIGHEEFNHHDALADSDACARIVLHMANRHEVESLDELMVKTSERLKTVF